MKRTTTTLLGLLLPLAVLACGETGTQEGAGMDEAAAGDTAEADTAEMAEEPGATVSLAAKGGSGITGDARLMPAGDSVRIALSLTGLTEGQDYPAHVHTGTCSAGGGVDQPLSSVTGQAGGTGSSTSTLGASAFADTTHFIQVHGSGGTPVACGDLPAPSAWQGGMAGEGAASGSGGEGMSGSEGASGGSGSGS